MILLADESVDAPTTVEAQPPIRSFSQPVSAIPSVLPDT